MITLGLLCVALGATPDVVFIIADDLNNDLGCYGHLEVKTPNLDRLAKRGVRFDRAYVQYPVCNPSRTSFLTGLRPTTTKVLGNQVHFRKTIPEVVTLPQLFRQNGYESIGLGKVFHRGLSPDETRPEMDDPKSFDQVMYGKTTETGRKGTGRNLTGNKLAWCRWQAAEGDDADQPDGQIANEAVRLLRTKREKPLFLAVGFYRPHDPFISPKKYFDLFDREKLTLPQTPRGYKVPYPHSLGGGAFATAFDAFTDRERREFLHAYYAGVRFVDSQVGKILDAIDKSGKAENTIIVFLGDHGYELGRRNWWNKNTLFESSCRTPLMIVDPAAKGKGKAAGGVVEMVDLYPTLVERCTLKNAPKRLEGVSLVKMLNDPTVEVKQAAITMVQRGKFAGFSVRTKRWRYTEWDAGRKGRELYDHEADPQEWINKADDPKLAEVIEKLKQRLNAS